MAEFKTSTEPMFRSAGYKAEQGQLVYFDVYLDEMFGIDLDYPGIKGALNAAFFESKRYVPVDTGLMKSSYVMRPKSDTLIECLFDPAKIVGQMRKGRKVTEYYPQWVGTSGPGNSAWEWLTTVVSKFIGKLMSEVKALGKSQTAKDREAEGRSSPKVGAVALAILAAVEANRKEASKARRESDKKKAENDREERERKSKWAS